MLHALVQGQDKFIDRYWPFGDHAALNFSNIQADKNFKIIASPNPTINELMIISKIKKLKINRIRINTVLGEQLGEIDTGESNSY